MNAVIPTATRPPASVSPAAGYSTALSALTRTGPHRWVTSLSAASSDSAAATWSGVRTACRQRAAESDPTGGTLAPAVIAVSASTARGSRRPAPAISPETASTKTATDQGRTRRCPRPSTSRATCGPAVASASANTAVVTPAEAKDPVAPRTAHSTPRIVIATPSLATAAVAKKAAAPGRLSTAR